MHPVWALAAWLAVGVAPGYALVRLLAPGLPRSLAAALAPAATWGVVAPLLPLLSSTETAIPAWAPWAWALAGLAAAALVEWTRRTTPLNVEGLRTSERWALALGVALAAGIWVGAVRDWTFAPGDDAVNHALFAARILAEGIVDPPTVTSPDPLAGISGVAYYPLTLHVIGAWMASIAGWPIAGAVPAAAIMTAIWTLPLGLVWLCRALLPGVPRAALLAPVAASCLATFPWEPVSFGGYPLMASTCVVPSVIAAWLFASRSPRFSGAVATGVAAAGAVMAHPSTLALLGVVGLALLGWPPGVGLARRDLLLSGLVVSAVSAVALSPGARQLLSAADERLGLASSPQLDWLLALVSLPFGGYAIVWPSAASVLLVLVGLVAGLKGPLRGWCAALVALWALELAASVAPGTWVATVTSPWYSLSNRLAMHAGLVALPLLAYGAALAWTWFEDLLKARTKASRAPRAVVASFGVAIALWGLASSWQLLSVGESRTARVRDADLAAWRYISAEVRQGERVLNDIRDGSPYLEVVHGVPVIWGVRVPAWDQSEWADRVALLANAEDIGGDPETDSTVRALDIRFVLRGGGGRTGFASTQLMDQDLAAAPGLRLVFTQGAVEVYEVVGARF